MAPPLDFNDPIVKCQCTTQPGVPNVFRPDALNVHTVGAKWFETERDITWIRTAEGFSVYTDTKIVDNKLVSTGAQQGICINKADW